MSEMVDRVAKAMLGVPLRGRGAIILGNLREPSLATDLAHDLARAAIEAMREPTSQMVESSKRYMDSYSSNLEWWDAMVDAALKD